MDVKDGIDVKEESNCTTDGKTQGEAMLVDVGKNGFELPVGYNLASSKPDDDTYNMKHEKRGYCLIFNHKNFDTRLSLGTRSGTDVDRDKLRFLFEKLGFEVIVHNDSSVKELKKTLTKYACDVNHRQCDAFVTCFMSHGEDGLLYGRDAMLKSDEIFTLFTAENCPTLAGKPKLFFIQACRGDQLDCGTKMVTIRDQVDAGEMKYTIPNHSDFLMCWSTVPGHYSWRNTTNGSWFVQSIFSVFGIHAATKDVLTMMTMVNRAMILNFESNCPSNSSMHSKKQTACMVSTLMRRIYLKPK